MRGSLRVESRLQCRCAGVLLLILRWGCVMKGCVGMVSMSRNGVLRCRQRLGLRRRVSRRIVVSMVWRRARQMAMVSLGGGIVERPLAWRVLQHGIVIHGEDGRAGGAKSRETRSRLYWTSIKLQREEKDSGTMARRKHSTIASRRMAS